MLLTKELHLNEYRGHDFGDERLNRKFDLYNDNVVGTPNRTAIENFSAVNYFNALLENYIFAFTYTKKGFVASYYRRGKFCGTMVINEDVKDIRRFFCATLKGIIPDDVLDILKYTNISLFEAAMRINYIISHDDILYKKTIVQQDSLSIVSKDNREETKATIDLFKVNENDTIVDDLIEPTYFGYGDFASKDLSKHSKILLNPIPSINADDESYKSISDNCTLLSNEVLNKITTDYASNFVEWGYTVICDTNEKNLNEEDTYQAYLNYQQYFLPENSKCLTRK